MAKSQLHDLARLGAQARLESLDRERQEILSLFPDLGSRASGTAGRSAEAKPPRRGGMSEEARKAQSARMTAYWAARRAAKAAAQDEAGGNGAENSARGTRRGRGGSRKK